MASGAMKSTGTQHGGFSSVLFLEGGGEEEKPHARLLFLLRAKLTFLPV